MDADFFRPCGKLHDEAAVSAACGPLCGLSVAEGWSEGGQTSWMDIGEMCRLHVLLSCCVYYQEQKWAPLLSAFNSKLEA